MKRFFIILILLAAGIASTFAQSTGGKTTKKKAKTAPAATPAPAPAPPPAPVVAAPPPPPPPPPAPAPAPEPVSTAPQWSGAATVNFGTNSWNLGFGVRVGATGLISSQPKIYLGAAGAYHLGESISGTSVRPYYLCVEGGYEIPIEGNPILIRPTVGLGFGGVSISPSNPFVSGSNGVLFSIGGNAIYSMPGSNLFFGGDARLLFRDGSVFLIGGMIGMKF
jgi:hypothetical protein